MFMRCILASLVLAASVAAQAASWDLASAPLKVDLIGSSGNGVPSGWQSLLPTVDYVPGGSQAFGWTAGTSRTGSDGAISEKMLTRLFTSDPWYDQHENLERDYHTVTGTGTFVVKLSSSLTSGDRVRVRALLSSPAHEQAGILVRALNSGGTQTLMTPEYHHAQAGTNDLTSAIGNIPNPQGVWLRTLASKAHLTVPEGIDDPDENYGGARSLWFTTWVSSSNTVELQFDSSLTSPDSPLSFVGSLEFYPYAEPPATFTDDDSSLTPLEINSSYSFASGDSAKCDTAFDTLNASGDVVSAKSTIAGSSPVSDEVTRAVALLWVAGWPAPQQPFFCLPSGDATNDADDIEWDCLYDAIALLSAHTSDVSRAALVAESLDKAQAYQRALLHQLLRGYGLVTLPSTEANHAVTLENPFEPENGKNLLLIQNLGVAEALWRELSWQQPEDVIGQSVTEVHPLFFKAALARAWNGWMRNTGNTWGPNPAGLATQVTDPDDIDKDAYYFIRQAYETWRELNETGHQLDDQFADHDDWRIGDHMANYDHDPGGHGGKDYDQRVWGGIVKHWRDAGQGEGKDVVHGTGADTWWAPLLADVSGCSFDDSWAVNERLLFGDLKAVHDWWHAYRAFDSQFGGGGPDDVEFLLQAYYLLKPFRQTLPELELAVRSLSQTLLADEAVIDGHFFGDGSTASAADVEHTAEPTSNPLWLGLHAFWGDPFFVEFAVQASERMVTPSMSGGRPWMATVIDGGVPPWAAAVAGHVHPYPASGTIYDVIVPRYFQAYYFDAEGSVLVDGDSIDRTGDIPLNGRAIWPAYVLTAYNNHPLISAKLREWAEWWWFVAMAHPNPISGPNFGKIAIVDPDQQDVSGYIRKPVGVLPALASFSQTTGYASYGEHPASGPHQWWIGGYDASSDAHLGDTINRCDYIYSLFLWRFLDPASDNPSTTTVNEAIDYLRPIFEASRLVAERYRIETCGSCCGGSLPSVYTGSFGSSSTPGSPYWTAVQLTNPFFLQQVALALPYYDTLDDGTTGVDSTLLANVKCLLEQVLQGSGAPVYAKTVLGNDGASSPDWTAFGTEFERVDTWLGAFFPLATTAVGYTDRIYASPNQEHQLFQQVATGGLAASYPHEQVTWDAVAEVESAGCLTTKPLQLSTLVKGKLADPGVWRALVVNHEPDPDGSGPITSRTVRARFWHQFAPGTYTLRVGINDGSDEVDTSLSYTDTSVDITHFGGHADFQIPYPGSGGACVERVLEVIGPSAPLTPGALTDLGISADDLGLEFANGGTRLKATVDVHNVGTTSAAANYQFTWRKTSNLTSGSAFVCQTAPTSGSVSFSSGLTTYTPVGVQSGSKAISTYSGTGSYYIELTCTLTSTGTNVDGNDVNDTARKVFKVTPLLITEVLPH